LFENSLLKQTIQVMDSAIANYEIDKTDFLSVIDAQMLYYKYEKEYYRALTDYYKALAQLEKETGTSIF